MCMMIERGEIEAKDLTEKHCYECNGKNCPPEHKTPDGICRNDKFREKCHPDDV